MTGHDIVSKYIENGYRPVFWKSEGDIKGPTTPGWPTRSYSLADYQDGDRVGLLTGVEISPGRFLHDVDVDWAPGTLIAQSLLPITSMVFGRKSKPISHCFYTCPEPLPSIRYEDVDKTCLIELRGTKANGEIGMQTMVPPSPWSKNGVVELLTYVRSEGPSFYQCEAVKRRTMLAAIAMIFAKHLGTNGFGHEPRLCWAGFLLRAGIEVEELVAMGEAISVYCNNKEIHDVRRTVVSTAEALDRGDKKVKGGPSLIRMLGTHGKAIIARINEWLGRNQDFLRDKTGKIIKDHQGNIRRAIEVLGYELTYEEFSAKMMISEGDHKQPLDDRMLDRMWLRIDRELHFRPSFVLYEKIVTDAAYDASYHPVRDYLMGLKWDGTPRINHWLMNYAGAEEHNDSSESRTYLEAVSAITLIAAVRRVMRPGCKYDEMLILESGQGLGKSSALRLLCPQEEWFSDDLPLDCDAKEIIERTLGKWIIESSDLTGGRKADQDQLKSMLSRQVDGPARMAYAHVPVERPRHFIIVGTTNSTEYLPDTTGARRFWPVRVQSFNLEAILHDRDQLWAEAVVREAEGESIRLPQDLWESAGKHQDQRREIDAWEQTIKEAIAVLEPTSSGRLQITADEIWMALGIEISRRDRTGAKRIAETMQRFGFKRTNVRTEDKKVMTGYVRDPSTVAMETVVSESLIAPEGKTEY